MTCWAAPTRRPRRRSGRCIPSAAGSDFADVDACTTNRRRRTGASTNSSTNANANARTKLTDPRLRPPPRCAADPPCGSSAATALAADRDESGWHALMPAPNAPPWCCERTARGSDGHGGGVGDLQRHRHPGSAPSGQSDWGVASPSLSRFPPPRRRQSPRTSPVRIPPVPRAQPGRPRRVADRHGHRFGGVCARGFRDEALEGRSSRRLRQELHGFRVEVTRDGWLKDLRERTGDSSIGGDRLQIHLPQRQRRLRHLHPGTGNAHGRVTAALPRRVLASRST